MSVPEKPKTVGDCQRVLQRVYEFLDHEIDQASEASIRAHLAACEPCLDAFDVEQTLKALVGRCCGGDLAPAELRVRVLAQMTVNRRRP